MPDIRDDSQRWREISPSAWEHERAGLAHVKALLPDADPYFAWANVEFVASDSSINEVDLLVLTPSGLYLVELKHWQGEISGNGTTWQVRSPSGNLRYEDNPVILANKKARRLAGLLEHYQRQAKKRGKVPFIRAAVFLHAPGSRSTLDEFGRQRVYGLHGDARSGLPSIQDLLTQQPADPRDAVDRTRAREIIAMIDAAGIRPSVADRTVQGLLLYPKPYAEGPGWQDYLAGHKLDTSLIRRVRFYLTSKASADERDVIARAADREFRLLLGIHHPGIVHAVDYVHHDLGPAVILEHDPDSVRLDHWLAEHHASLTTEQRLTLIRDLAEIMQYAHSRHLAHRSLNPRSVLVRNPDDPHPQLVVTDWQAGGRTGTTAQTLLGGTVHADVLADDATRLYQAPEAATNPDAPGHLLDVFSLGAIAYLTITGHQPAPTAAKLAERLAEQESLRLSAAVDGISTMLDYLVAQATQGDTARRTESVAEFLADLDEVEKELTSPEPPEVVDPLEAKPGELLDGGLEVVRRLGKGATAMALLVRREADGELLVLKVARDEEKRQRLLDEAARLQGLKHWQVAALEGEPLIVGGRTAFLMEVAGEQTLANSLQSHGRLSIDLLERFGRDLLDIVAYLDGQGVMHRDIKPANLAARPRPKDKQPHLCVFDLSLATAPADQLKAGTPPYLDPFLGNKFGRPRYDLAAERFAAAVTLYEMATGTVPRWGDGIGDPAMSPDEVTIAQDVFDPAIAEGLAAFFTKALARDARQRYDTVEEMADAWRAIFRNIAPAKAAAPIQATVAGQVLTIDTPIDLVGFTERARSAVERFGVRTVGDLVAYDAAALNRLEGVPQATKSEIRRRAKDLRRLFAPGTPTSPPVPEPATSAGRAHGIEALLEQLLPEQTKRNDNEVLALRVVLGLGAPPGGKHLHWPTQAEAAQAIGATQANVSRLLRAQLQRWGNDSDLADVCDEIVALLDANGSVMSAGELAQALISSRGSFATGERRTAQALGLVRVAVETELERGGDSRIGTRRFGNTVLIGREPDDPTAAHTAEDLTGYAVHLGRVARQLTAADPLPTPARAVQRLRQTTPPPAMPVLSDARLLQLAAAAADDVAVNAQLQLYPVGLGPQRALRLAAGSLVLTRDQTLDVASLRNRVAARFPHAADLPERPKLDELLKASGIALEWDPPQQAYRAPAPPSGTLFATSTRLATAGPQTAADEDPAAEAHSRIKAALDRNAFLALLVTPSHVNAARRRLLARLKLTEVDVTRALIETLRGIGVPWDLIVNSDALPAGAPDRRNLEHAVRDTVKPRVVEAIEKADGPVLITEAAPLARYGCMDVLADLADNANPKPAARFLLAPAWRPQPMLDNQPIPVTSTAQWMWLPEDWYAQPNAGKDVTA